MPFRQEEVPQRYRALVRFYNVIQELFFQAFEDGERLEALIKSDAEPETVSKVFNQMISGYLSICKAINDARIKSGEFPV